MRSREELQKDIEELRRITGKHTITNDDLPKLSGSYPLPDLPPPFRKVKSYSELLYYRNKNKNND